MTKINLKYGYYIETESMCYTIRKKFRGKDKKGNPKESVKTYGYFSSMKNAIERYLKEILEEVLDGEEMDLKAYAEQVDKVIKLAVQGLDKVLSDYAVK